MSRVLGLDLGTKRTGVAISDDLRITAQAVGVRDRIGYKSDLKWIRELLAQYEIETIVIGRPINMDATVGERALEAERFAKKLAKDVPCEIKLWDERLSTVSAEKALIETGTSRKKRKKVIDQVAAQLILSNWMSANPKRRE